MLRPQGYGVWVDPQQSQPLVERDTVSCCHCGQIIFVKPGTVSTVYLVFNAATWLWEEVPGASCYHCWQPVCLPCHDLGVCLPLERRLAQMEGRTDRQVLLGGR